MACPMSEAPTTVVIQRYLYEMGGDSPAADLHEGLVPAPASSVSGLSPDGLRMLRAIDQLPEDEREAFDLVRVQGITQAEAAHLRGVSAVTVKRQLNRGLWLLS